MDNDTYPWETLSKRRISKKMADSMEGDLTLDELEESFFEHMNGSSSPGIDGFMDNYMAAFWPLFKYVTKDALNAIQRYGLSQSLRSSILKLLWKGEKNLLETGSYQPISLLSIFYKLASCCIIRRIKSAVKKLKK